MELTGLRFGALPDTARHLCVDCQRLFAPPAPWAVDWMPAVLPRVLDLVARRPQRTIFTRFMPPARVEDAVGGWQRLYRAWPNLVGTRIDPALLDLLPELQAFVPPAVVADKGGYSAFTVPHLASRLAARGIDTLIVSGGESEVCILATVLDAVDHGFRVVIAADAICSSSDRGHDDFLALFARRFGNQVETATVADIRDAWR